MTPNEIDKRNYEMRSNPFLQLGFHFGFALLRFGHLVSQGTDAGHLRDAGQLLAHIADVFRGHLAALDGHLYG